MHKSTSIIILLELWVRREALDPSEGNHGGFQQDSKENLQLKQKKSPKNKHCSAGGWVTANVETKYHPSDDRDLRNGGSHVSHTLNGHL